MAGKQTPKAPYGDQTPYADPGYQSDKKNRYPLDTEAHVRAAWSYINQVGNGARYSPAQREQIKARIAAAAKKFGIELATEAAVYERLRAAYGAVKMAPAAKPASMVPISYEAESALIAANAKHPKALARHPFVPAVHPAPEGTPRCLLCGDTLPASGVCNDTPGKEGDPQPKLIPNAAKLDMSAVPPITAQAYIYPAVITSNTMSWPNLTFSTSARQPVEGVVVEPPRAKAFLAEIDGHTVLTAPAVAAERAAAGNDQFLWIGGRFVGAEKPNRNGAMWTTADLELGQFTVKNGPLNWLHEARHIIGSITDGQLVDRDMAADQPLAEPYIQTTAAVWKWLYPDEAGVIQQASDAGALWQSMECISKDVVCDGPSGCGAVVSYADYCAKRSCAHVQERSSIRRFSDPTFLGGAVIVPPVRPGWAEADTRVIRQAASLAEETFDKAGCPDMTAAQWEILMQGIVRSVMPA